MEEIFIVGAARTPIGKFAGSLAKTPAAALGALVIRKVLERSRVGAEQVSEVIMGQVLTAATGQNPARRTASRTTTAPNLGAGSGDNPPWKRPKGVRTPDTMTASLMSLSITKRRRPRRVG